MQASSLSSLRRLPVPPDAAEKDGKRGGRHDINVGAGMAGFGLLVYGGDSSRTKIVVLLDRGSK